MSTAFVLSGGGAAGDFQVGALRLMIGRGIQPDILIGTSVGAINAAKLAEGEGAPDQGFAGLLSIWLAMRENGQMWAPAPWLAALHPEIQRMVIHFVAPHFNRPVDSPDDIQRAVNFLHWAVNDGKDILNAILQAIAGVLDGPRSLLTFDPIFGRIQSSLNTARVRASGRTLRLVTVALDSGRVRFVTENGALVESDQVTRVGTMPGPVPPRVGELRSSIASLDTEIAGIDQALQTASPAEKPGLGRKRLELTTARNALRSELAALVASIAPVPLDVSLPIGILASSSLAVFLPPVQLGDESYVDGGHRDQMSSETAVRLGATEIFAVLAAPAALDAPTPDNPRPQRVSYAQKSLLEILPRALLGIHLNEMVANDILPPRGFNGPFKLIAPRVYVHGVLDIDPGLIRQNIGYGFMVAADTLDGIDPASAAATAADEITLLRAQMWRKECELFGKPVPSAHDSVVGPPLPSHYPQLLNDAARLRGLVASRRQAGGLLPPEADRWGTTWEDHPWPAASEGPATALSPSTDVIEVFAHSQEGRAMTASFAPGTQWRGWRGVAYGYGRPDGWMEAVAVGDEVHAFAVAADGAVIRSVRPLGGRVWSPWWPAGGARGVPGAPVHAVVRAGRIDLFYTSNIGAAMTTGWSASTGWSQAREIQGAKTIPGGHVTAVSRNPARLDVFMVAHQGPVLTAGLSAGGNWSGWFATSAPAHTIDGSFVSAVSRGPELIDIFFADANGRIVSSAFDPARGWIHIGPIQAGVTDAGTYVTAVCARPDNLDIFCVGTDRRVWTAFWSPAQGWRGWVTASGSQARPGRPVWPVSRRPGQIDIIYTTMSNTIETAGCPGSGSPWTAPSRISGEWQLDDLM